MSHRTWKFIVNNYSNKDVEQFKMLDTKLTVFGEEVGEKTNTPHLQGHIIFKRTYRLSALKKINERAHWEPAKCEDFNYETKGDNIFMKDNRKQGHRTDLDDVADAIKQGQSIKEIASNHTSSFIKYHKGIERTHEILVTEVEGAEYDITSCEDHLGVGKLDGIKSAIILGKSGCGKTQFALAHFKRPLMVRHIDDLKKFNSEYDGIVFDDMDFRHMPRTSQIHLVDWDNNSSIHCRYANAKIPKHTKKIFTCNIYPFDDDPAIARRVSVTEVGGR